MNAPVRHNPALALSVALVALQAAEAECNAVIAMLANGDADLSKIGRKPEDVIREVKSRVYDARRRLDEVRFDKLDVETLNGTRLTPNDDDDMLDAMLHRASRNYYGTDDGESAPYIDPNDEHRLGARDYGVERYA